MIHSCIHFTLVVHQVNVPPNEIPIVVSDLAVSATLYPPTYLKRLTVFTKLKNTYVLMSIDRNVKCSFSLIFSNNIRHGDLLDELIPPHFTATESLHKRRLLLKSCLANATSTLDYNASFLYTYQHAKLQHTTAVIH